MKLSGDKLTEAFMQLGYQHPVEESDISTLIIDGIWKSYASDKLTYE